MSGPLLEWQKSNVPEYLERVAALVSEELGHLHDEVPEARAATRAYYPGRRVPAHVYQRVGLLELILEDLVQAWGAAATPSDVES